MTVKRNTVGRPGRNRQTKSERDELNQKGVL